MRLIASSLMAGIIALGAVSPAFADPPRYNYGRDYDRGRDRDRDWDRDRDRGWDRDWKRDRDRGWDRDYRYDNRYYNKKWRKGDRFDRRVHYNYVVVNDYNRYRDHRGYYLRPPPRGHYYVRDNNTGDILLIAAATGLILWALNDW